MNTPASPFGRPADASSSTPASRGIPDSDTDLLRRVQGGDPVAASVLYERYARRLRALARRRTPDRIRPMVESVDIVQSAMGSFFRRASRGDYDLPAGLELWGLLLAITLNKIKDKGSFHYSRKRDVRRTTRLGSGPNDRDSDRALATDADAATCQVRIWIDDVLRGLDTDRRSMIELRIAGCSVDEIALETGRAKRTVERVLQDARRAFHEALTRDGPAR